jgi:hypothetical protein
LKVKRQKHIATLKKSKADQYLTEDKSYRPQVDPNSRKILEKKAKSTKIGGEGDEGQTQEKKDKFKELIDRGKEYKEKREKLAKERQEQGEKYSFKPQL